MTKFEEEVKRPKKAYIDPFSKRDVDFTGVAKKFTEGAQTLKEWKEYAFLLEDKLKLQQSLPVVPEFVNKFLKSKPIFNIVKYPIPIEIISWANKQTGYMDLEINITYLIKLKTNGYTVEKPQLFYLKNKITGKYLRSYTGLSMDDRTLRYEEVKDKRVGGFGGGTTFTQSEIGSMETGSYEQIEVAE